MVYPLLGFRKNLTLLLILLLSFVAVFHAAYVAQAQSPVTSRVDRTSLARNEQVTLTISVTGDFLNIPNPDLSQLQDFVVVSSSSSTQVSIVNGNMSTQRVFIYRLQPLNEGSLVIGPVSVIVGSKIYKTDPIEVEVLPSGTQITPPGSKAPDSDAPDALERDFFVEAEVSNPNPYLGEQIIYIFKLHQAVQFPVGQPDYQPPSFTDFWDHEFTYQPQHQTRVNGRDYLVTEIHTALFPANLGSITIDPAALIIPGGLFSPDIKLETNPVTIQVQPLPQNAPEDFRGAVGQYDIKASLTPIETKVNEPVTLLVEIEGTGNLQAITEPELPNLTGWRFFEGQASTLTDTDDGMLRGIRSFERLVVPGQPGEQTFPPINFSYFDPQLDTYQTISTDPIPITVLPDDSIQAPIGRTGPDAASDPAGGRLAFDIRHIKPVPTSLNTSLDSSAIGWGIYWSCWLLPALAMGGVYIWQSRQRRLRQDTAYARDVRARRIALKMLDDVSHAGPGNEADIAGRALLGYLSDKLNRPTTGLTTDNLIQLLRQTRLREDLINRVATLLHQIDIGRYAPIATGTEQTILADTRQLINDLEKSLGKRR